MKKRPTNEPRACTSHFSFLMNAGKPKLGFINLKCRVCGKEFLSNVLNDICVECKRLIV